jgi:hypothetical protein
MKEPQEGVLVGVEFLQRLSINPRHDAGNQPTRLAHLDHGNKSAMLIKGGEGSAQVVRRRHGEAPQG